MADVVADVMGEGTYGECEFVGGVGVVEKAQDEVSGADIVGEVGEEGIAEGGSNRSPEWRSRRKRKREPAGAVFR